MIKSIKRFDVWLVSLDPTVGSEIKKTRPCVIISPDEMSKLATVIVAPLTTKGFHFPMRVECTFMSNNNLILLDQLRAVDKTRLIKKIGTIESDTAKKTSNLLVEMFAYD